MKTAIIIHGMPSKEEYFNPDRDSQSNSHWFPWIQKELCIRGILAQTPEMPEPYEPVYEQWKKVFEQFAIREETILVGHSCGGGFLVRWLSEHKVRVGKVILVAPWIDTEKELKTGMFDFEIDGEVADRTNGMAMLYATDDDAVILESVRTLKRNIKNLSVREFPDKGHFTRGDMGTDAFPELLETILA